MHSQEKIDSLSLNIEKEFKSLEGRLKDKYLMLVCQYMQREEIYRFFKHNKREAL